MSKLTENTSKIQGLLNDISNLPKDRYEEGIQQGKAFGRSIIDRSITEITEKDLEGVTAIGNYSFHSCKNLTSITMPDSITSIGTYSFYGCSALKSLILSKSITAIPDEAFDGCKALENFIFHEGIKRTGRSSFQGCAFSEVVLPSTFEWFSTYSFYFCKELKSVTVKAITPPSLQSNTFQNTPEDMVFYVPAQSIETYKTATNWSAYADRIFAIEE